MLKAKSTMALTAELVARCQRHEPDPGPEPGRRHLTEEEREAVVQSLLQRRPPGPLWVFAYGSLIWRPACETTSQEVAIAYGWHRAFTMELRRWRGSPQQPGLMLALERGGRCTGIAYQLPEGDELEQLRRLLQREVSAEDGLCAIRWIAINGSAQRRRALVFWAAPMRYQHRVRLPPEQVAKILARACGHMGSGAEYLFHTVQELERHGIHDRGLWRLQQLVAEEILNLEKSGA